MCSTVAVPRCHGLITSGELSQPCFTSPLLVYLTIIGDVGIIRKKVKSALFDIACLNEQSRNNDVHEGSSDGVLSDFPTVYCGIL